MLYIRSRGITSTRRADVGPSKARRRLDEHVEGDLSTHWNVDIRVHGPVSMAVTIRAFMGPIRRGSPATLKVCSSIRMPFTPTHSRCNSVQSERSLKRSRPPDQADLPLRDSSRAFTGDNPIDGHLARVFPFLTGRCLMERLYNPIMVLNQPFRPSSWGFERSHWVGPAHECD